MAILPESYCQRMQQLLGEEFKAYEKSFSEPSHTAFRVNTRKISLEEWRQKNPFSTTVVPWCEKGFYYDAEKETPSKHPYYYAGLYYIQEPSAMIPAGILPIEEGDLVLDLCAAPGGKATELGSRLNGTGLLVANDISVSRTNALVKNLQLAGNSNIVVTAETPEHLSQAFPNYFHKILIDAPCSGEGMFRREPRMIKDWIEKGPKYYAAIQKEILSYAYEMLRAGGRMVYSTCTFSKEEDEEIIKWFLQQYSDMEICDVQRKDGFSEGMDAEEMVRHCIRIFPHRAKGEGHFAVLLRKKEKRSEESNENQVCNRDGTFQNTDRFSEESLQEITIANPKKIPADKMLTQELRKQLGAAADDIKQFLQQLLLQEGRLEWRKDTLIWHSLLEPKCSSLRVVQSGMPICKWKYKVLPSPQLALCLQEGDYTNTWNLSAEDENVIRYLKGETLQTEESFQGNVLVMVDGYGLGWCQGNGKGTLKNKYHPGWRYV